MSEGFEGLFSYGEQDDQLLDVITGKPFQEMSENRAQWKNDYLTKKQLSLELKTDQDPRVANIRGEALRLPTADMRWVAELPTNSFSLPNVSYLDMQKKRSCLLT